jgi:hypothetical protein
MPSGAGFSFASFGGVLRSGVINAAAFLRKKLAVHFRD